MRKLSLDDLRRLTRRDVSVRARIRPGVWTFAIVIAAILGGGLVFLGDDYAGAAGGRNFQPLQVPEQPVVTLPTVDAGPAQPKRRRSGSERSGLGQAVCVRLCDGYFFPLSATSNAEGSCNALCPDAQSAVYRELAGSDNVDDAISTTGAPYTALPAAGRYRANVDAACTCHRQNVNYSHLALLDPTLRRGDMVMTPKGLLVFEGSSALSARPKDFVTVAQSKLAPSNMRADLTKLRSSSQVWKGLSYAPAFSSPFDKR